MSTYLRNIKKEMRFHIKPIKDDIAQRKNKDFFIYTGTQIYSGRQGDGKTICAVKHTKDMKEKYPKAKIVSNLKLYDYKAREFENEKELMYLSENLKNDEYILFKDFEELAMVLTMVNNGYKGVIYLIDEIHSYFNALDSKNIPMYVFTEISQQRKQRKVIIGTSQLFPRVAKPLREQCDSLMICRTFFNVFTYIKAYDGMEVVFDERSSKPHGLIRKRGFFWHSRELRNSYDTFQKVTSGLEQLQQSTMELKKRGKVRRVV